ncbi:hypothetical protein VTN00DRAFT_5999 [Thermoascus crustaceus]|uniref:uncharacterized protein n=1 Tax=Thermoascus crustaceus TaxID=5088 RepID=UPI003742F664
MGMGEREEWEKARRPILAGEGSVPGMDASGCGANARRAGGALLKTCPLAAGQPGWGTLICSSHLQVCAVLGTTMPETAHQGAKTHCKVPMRGRGHELSTMSCQCLLALGRAPVAADMHRASARYIDLPAGTPHDVKIIRLACLRTKPLPFTSRLIWLQLARADRSSPLVAQGRISSAPARAVRRIL